MCVAGSLHVAFFVPTVLVLAASTCRRRLRAVPAGILPCRPRCGLVFQGKRCTGDQPAKMLRSNSWNEDKRNERATCYNFCRGRGNRWHKISCDATINATTIDTGGKHLPCAAHASNVGKVNDRDRKQAREYDSGKRRETERERETKREWE